MSKKYHPHIRAAVNIAAGIFILYFSYAIFLLVWSVAKNGQVSVSMTWLPMYLVYLGVLIAFLLMGYEFLKFGLAFFLVREKSEK